MSNLNQPIFTVPNVITLSRLILIPIFLLYMYRGLTGYFPSIFFDTLLALNIYLVIRLTDFLDGWVARLTKSTSILGSFLDVWVDLIFVLSSFIILNILNLAPIWLTILIIYKFFEFLILSQITRKHFLEMGIIRDNVLYYDLPGRFVSCIFYTLPSIVLIFKLLCIDSILLHVIYYGILLLTLVSSLLKFRNIKNLTNLENMSVLVTDNSHKVGI